MWTILLLAQIAVAPSPSPSPAARPTPQAPLVRVEGARPAKVEAPGSLPTSLSDYARDRRLKKTGTGSGTVSTAGGTGASGGAALPPPLVEDEREAAKIAQNRMDRAVIEGRSVDENVGASTSARSVARTEWDSAAESCRKTPGCIPTYRSNGATKVLKTDEELLQDLARRSGMSGALRPDR